MEMNEITSKMSFLRVRSPLLAKALSPDLKRLEKRFESHLKQVNRIAAAQAAARPSAVSQLEDLQLKLIQTRDLLLKIESKTRGPHGN